MNETAQNAPGHARPRRKPAAQTLPPDMELELLGAALAAMLEAGWRVKAENQAGQVALAVVGAELDFTATPPKLRRLTTASAPEVTK